MSIDIATPVGTAQVHLSAPKRKPAGLLVLGHGAGGGIEAADLVAVTEAAVAARLAVARVLQPYRVAGRRAPAPAGQLDSAWSAVVGHVRKDFAGLPLIAGGRSSGARVACRTATELGALGVLTLAFPLHPPGRPERSRLPELQGAGVPVLVIQGERDAFGRPEEFPPGTPLVMVPGADHALVPRRDRHAFDEIAASAVAWCSGILRAR